MFYEPVGVGSSPDGRCGEAGDNIVVDGGYHSTIRTISAVDSTPGSVRIVDPEAVFSEFIDNAVSAGVGSECFQDEP